MFGVAIAIRSRKAESLTCPPDEVAGHLCCGRCGRIELLLEAANRLADSTLQDAAISQAMVVKSQAEESGV